MRNADMTPKNANVLRRLAKEADALKTSRSRTGKRTGVSSRARDFWRALSAVTLSSPHTAVLRRHHD